MKLTELLKENDDATTEEDFAEDLETILYAAYANEFTKISTKSLAKEMQKLGYQTDLGHVSNVAKTIPIVSYASNSVVSIGEDVVDDIANTSDEVEDADADESEVSDIASKAAIDDVTEK